MFLSQLPANKISGPVRGGESARHVTGAVAPRYGKDIWLNYKKTSLVSVPSIDCSKGGDGYSSLLSTSKAILLAVPVLSATKMVFE